MEKTKINNIKIKPIEGLEKKKCLNGIFNDTYQNVYICAKKKSGKTTLIYRLVEKMIKRNTVVFIFASTIGKDETYRELLKMLERKNIEHHAYQSLNEDNAFDDMIEALMHKDEEAEEKTESEEENEQPIIITGNERKKRRKTKKKPIVLEYILIFDDLSDELRNPRISSLLKKNRHLKANTIISSQYYSDLTPASRMNIDVFILFGGHPISKLEELFKSMDLSISFDEFLKLYEDATSSRFNFLFVDKNEDQIRHNLDKCYLSPK